MKSLCRVHAVKRISIILCIFGTLGCLVFFAPSGQVAAQVRVSATPLSASLPQAQPQAVQQESVFVSPTAAPTETPLPGVFLEVKPDLGEADTRELPDLEDGIKLESIAAGTPYLVTGRYFRWLQFRYDKSGTGYGWVFEDLIDLSGEGSTPEIDPFALPSATPPPGGNEETRVAVTLTPGAVETLDAQARVIVLADMVSTEELENAGVLPTFTKPAELAPRDAPAAQQQSETNAFEETLVRAAAGQIPPLVPILILAAAGMLGMIVSVWRR